MEDEAVAIAMLFFPNHLGWFQTMLMPVIPITASRNLS
jgi:hypothetical protein